MYSLILVRHVVRSSSASRRLCAVGLQALGQLGGSAERGEVAAVDHVAREAEPRRREVADEAQRA
jgi:hypothetical protein